MHTIYKALPPEEVKRIIAYCQNHTIQKGGLFEVYAGPDEMTKMIVVNSSPENEPLKNFRPLGAFYCNYLGPGIISLEEEGPDHDGMPSAQLHIKSTKNVIDLLIEQGYPGKTIQYKNLEGSE